MDPFLLIVGASVRTAAFSALRAGIRPVCRRSVRRSGPSSLLSRGTTCSRYLSPRFSRSASPGRLSRLLDVHRRPGESSRGGLGYLPAAALVWQPSRGPRTSSESLSNCFLPEKCRHPLPGSTDGWTREYREMALQASRRRRRSGHQPVGGKAPASLQPHTVLLAGVH